MPLIDLSLDTHIGLYRSCFDRQKRLRCGVPSRTSNKSIPVLAHSRLALPKKKLGHTVRSCSLQSLGVCFASIRTSSPSHKVVLSPTRLMEAAVSRRSRFHSLMVSVRSWSSEKCHHSTSEERRRCETRRGNVWTSKRKCARQADDILWSPKPPRQADDVLLSPKPPRQADDILWSPKQTIFCGHQSRPDKQTIRSVLFSIQNVVYHFCSHICPEKLRGSICH